MKVENRANRPFFVSVKSLLDDGPAEVHEIDPQNTEQQSFSVSTGVGHMKVSTTRDFRTLEWEGYVPITNLEIRERGKVEVHDGDTFIPSFASPKLPGIREFFGSRRGSKDKKQAKFSLGWWVLLICIVLFLIFFSLRDR